MKTLICNLLIISAVSTYGGSTQDWLTIDCNVSAEIALGSIEAKAPELSLDLRSGSLCAGSLNLGYNVTDAITLNSIGTFIIESAGTGAEWRWQVSGVGGTALRNQMNLGRDGKLSIFGIDGRSVVIDPNAESVQIFGQSGSTRSLLTQDTAGNVSIEGNLKVAGNQVLTQSSATPAASLAILGGSTTSSQAVVIGLGANATGFLPTLALGAMSYANNSGAIAIGRNSLADGS